MEHINRWVRVIALAIVVGLIPGAVMAQSSSPNYQVEETFFGTGGEVDMSSPNYRGHGSAGSLGTGQSSSDNYTAEAGFLTARDEFLEFIVNAATIDFGLLSTDTTATGTATFSVRAYTSSGYSVQTLSPPPINANGEPLTPMTVLGDSTPGTEQFGINLVGNTIPTVFGANPWQAPDNTFAFGEAAPGYDVSNKYKYDIGNIIAFSSKGIGQTDYTISYIANASPLTTAGVYSIDHILVVVANY